MKLDIGTIDRLEFMIFSSIARALALAHSYIYLYICYRRRELEKKSLQQPK